MPCRSCPDEPSGRGSHTVYQDNPYHKKQLDKVTALLCFTLTNLPKSQRDILLAKSKNLKNWWSEHQKQDRARLDRQRNKREHEKTKANALSKLTFKERKALGLK